MHVTVHLAEHAVPHYMVHVDEHTSAAGIRSSADDLLSGDHVVYDLGRLRFLRSDVLGALVGAVRRVRSAGGAVAVVCDDAVVRSALHRVGFDAIVDVVADRRDMILRWLERSAQPISGQSAGERGALR